MITTGGATAYVIDDEKEDNDASSASSLKNHTCFI